MLARIDEGLKADVDNPGLWKNKAIILGKLGRTGEGDACFERFLDLQAKRPSSYYQLRDMAVGRDQRGKYELAVKCCDATLRVNERDANVWHHKAIILHKMGRYEETLVSCKEGLAIEPRNHELWNVQAATLIGLARFEEALLACNRGLEIEADYILLLRNKVTALNSLGRSAEAEKCSCQADELETIEWLLEPTDNSGPAKA